jgi:dihydroxy-acid dehydratase
MATAISTRPKIPCIFPSIFKGDAVVIRYEGPKGGPGMPEMLTPTSAIMGTGLGKDVAMITDGRFSGGSHGVIVGHITPEAQEGGPIALVRTGDTITIDTANHTIALDVDPAEMTRRRKSWTQPSYKVSHRILYKYIKTVRSASEWPSRTVCHRVPVIIKAAVTSAMAIR